MTRETPLVELRIGETFRYPAHGSRDPAVPKVDGFRNFFHATHTKGARTQAQLESGINPMREIQAVDGSRRPAVLVRSSPRKAGSSTTPWHDRYDLDGGRVRYFGDAKVRHMPDPHKARGNAVMRRLFDSHSSPDQAARAAACPLLFFVSSRPGHVEFRGCGVIETVELVSQIDSTSGRPFSNYAYDCALISLATEGEELPWHWVEVRRDARSTVNEALAAAPAAWQTWVADGHAGLGKVRRTVARAGTLRSTEQAPPPGSADAEALATIMRFYSRDGTARRARFEALAELIVEYIVEESGGRYVRGWVTRGVGDRGIDFVGRLDVGSGISSVSQVVLGQAKCEEPSSTTNGRDIARTVARLRRGWIGAYVTTATFTRQTQEEVREDRYPIMLVPGAEVARVTRAMAIRDGVSVEQLVERVDKGYEGRLRNRDPEEVLHV